MTAMGISPHPSAMAQVGPANQGGHISGSTAHRLGMMPIAMSVSMAKVWMMGLATQIAFFGAHLSFGLVVDTVFAMTYDRRFVGSRLSGVQRQ